MLVGRITAVVAILLAMITARPLLGSFDQAFQYIQEFTGFFTPGIGVIFLLGLFWKRGDRGRRADRRGDLGAAVARDVEVMPDFPFMNRMLVVFLAALALAVIVSLVRPQAAAADRIGTRGLDYATSASFNIFGLGVILILVALYATWW